MAEQDAIQEATSAVRAGEAALKKFYGEVAGLAKAISAVATEVTGGLDRIRRERNDAIAAIQLQRQIAIIAIQNADNPSFQTGADSGRRGGGYQTPNS